MPISTVLYNIILSPITQLIEISYRLFNKMFGNTGIAILGVSLTVTLLCLPLYIVAEGWQETERNIQDRMKSGINRIKKAFKGDEQYMILNTYYKQNHYHPIMALRSSFGILIQIPFFLAAYHTLSSLPDLMGRSFFFIRDMGKPDAIFSIAGFNVNILPIAMTVINCISGAIYSKGHSIREKIQIYGMAAVFLVVLYDSPAGLVLYWTMNNIF
ncbi:MAG: membrane protein insertase YidC, partial [Treponema sp.]|nr:membrane protein insertase YidC [Treponema sp.]